MRHEGELKREDSSDQELSHESLFSNYEEPSIKGPLTVKEKRKGKPSLQNVLAQVYANPSPEESNLLEGLQESTNNFIQSSQKINPARNEYLAVKNLADFASYGMATFIMIVQLFDQEVSLYTLPEAGVIAGIFSFFTRLSKNENGKTAYDLVKEAKDKFKNARQQQNYQKKAVYAYLNKLGFGDIDELKEHYPISTAVKEISGFFAEREDYEKIQREIMSRIESRDN